VADSISGLEQWFGTEPQWVREAARRLYENGCLEESDYDDLIKIAKSEKNALQDGEVAPVAQMPTALLAATQRSRATVKLIAIQDPVGINDLAPRQPLEFNQEGLTVVYGRNGSGKSGYARLLKQVCSSPLAEPILGNVFESERKDQQCTVRYSVNGREESFVWTPNVLPNEDLASVRILDTQTCEHYVRGEHEAIYEPPVLEVFTQLGDKVTESLKSRLESEIGAIDVASPVPPTDLVEANIAKRVQNAVTQEDLTGLREDSVLSDEEKARKTEIETSLAAPNPTAELAKVNARLDQLQGLLATLKSWATVFVAATSKKLDELRESVALKVQVSAAAASELAKPGMLPGVGTEVWKELWSLARRYSTEAAYPGIEFPNVSDGAQCVLCHQPLDQDARSRFRSFETFVIGASEAELKEAKDALQKVLNELPVVPAAESFETTLQACGITDPKDSETLLSHRALAEIWRAWMIQPAGSPPNDLGADSAALVGAARASEAARKDLLTKRSDPEERSRMSAELRELKAREWFARIIDSLAPILERRRRAKALRAVLPLFQTTAISTKKGQLTAELISNAFADRVKEELGKLGASDLRVKLQRQGTRYGHVPHKITLDGCQGQVDAIRVLSEGECKVVSLATFLAHMRADPHPVPFVFDDPVNSLDDEFEDAVVARLVGLATERQVIVFTHRISLLVKLRDAGPDGAVTPIAVDREVWGTGQPRSIPIYAQKARPALDAIRAKVQAAQQKQEELGMDAVEHELKGLASDIRICVEDLVERVLLDEIVLRFRRGVQTYNRIHKLADISDEDCKKIDGWMSSYSQFEHSQPAEISPSTPDPAKLISDIDEMVGWIDAVKARRK
jgi:energy-coupling factor transporter ATP-binding protein EcfA2